MSKIPEMPEGFTDRAAWDAIHWEPSKEGSLIDEAVIGWQLDNQDRVKAAIKALDESLAAQNASNNS